MKKLKYFHWHTETILQIELVAANKEHEERNMFVEKWTLYVCDSLDLQQKAVKEISFDGFGDGWYLLSYLALSFTLMLNDIIIYVGMRINYIFFFDYCILITKWVVYIIIVYFIVCITSYTSKFMVFCYQKPSFKMLLQLIFLLRKYFFNASLPQFFSFFFTSIKYY